jgi:dipeptidyl aminopeptidase/acylaminoacyl peptidase
VIEPGEGAAGHGDDEQERAHQNLPARRTAPPPGNGVICAVADSPPGQGYPGWSPDGRSLVFHSSAMGHFQLYVVSRSADSSWGTPRRLVQGDGRMGRWSPDGRQIVFASEPDACTSMHVGACNDQPFTFDIYVMNADGTGIRNVTSAPEFEGRPAWGPAG